MKTYNIYTNPSGHVEAIKQGWSWPGFFFTWIWCFVKKLYGLGIGLSIFFLITILMRKVSQEMSVLAFLVRFGVLIWIGSSGNEMRGKKLLENGYKFEGAINALSPEDAIAEFGKKAIDDDLKLLPDEIQCPNCGADLKLNDIEKKEGNFTCYVCKELFVVKN